VGDSRGLDLGMARRITYILNTKRGNKKEEKKKKGGGGKSVCEAKRV